MECCQRGLIVILGREYCLPLTASEVPSYPVELDDRRLIIPSSSSLKRPRSPSESVSEETVSMDSEDSFSEDDDYWQESGGIARRIISMIVKIFDDQKKASQLEEQEQKVRTASGEGGGDGGQSQEGSVEPEEDVEAGEGDESAAGPVELRAGSSDCSELTVSNSSLAAEAGDLDEDFHDDIEDEELEQEQVDENDDAEQWRPQRLCMKAVEALLLRHEQVIAEGGPNIPFTFHEEQFRRVMKVLEEDEQADREEREADAEEVVGGQDGDVEDKQIEVVEREEQPRNPAQQRSNQKLRFEGENDEEAGGGPAA